MTLDVPPTRWRVLQVLPIVEQLRGYQSAWLRGDLVAGVVVAALIIPKNLGYAEIAGVPLENGLYAAAAGTILYALFGSCRQISMGPSSGLAAVAGGAVLATGLTDPCDVATLVAGITLTSGLFFLALAVFRMGWLSQFLSRAVVTGFLFGAAIDVVIGELPKLTGTDSEGDNSFQELWSWLSTLDEAHAATVVVGVVALVVVFGLRWVAPRVPGALVLLVGGLLAAAVLDLRARGVALVGDIPRGLPSFDVPDLGLLVDHAGTVLVAAFALVMIGFSQTAGDARAYGGQAPLPGRHRPGVGRPVGGEHRRRAPQRDAGLDEPVRQLAQRPLGSAHRPGVPDLRGHRPPGAPRPGAPLLVPAQAGPRRTHHRGGRHGDDGRRRDATAAPGVEGPTSGWRRPRSSGPSSSASSPGWSSASRCPCCGSCTSPRTRSCSTLGRERGTQVFRDLDQHPEDETLPGVVVMRMDGGVFFATADALEDRVRDRHAGPGRQAAWCCTSPGSTSWTRRAPRRCRRSSGWRRSRGRAAAGGGPAGGTRHARARGCGGAARGRPRPRQRPPGRLPDRDVPGTPGEGNRRLRGR